MIFKKSILIPFISILLIGSFPAYSQNSNFRAQGNYYSAKSNFEANNYATALEYIYKCKTALGGTNYQVQYIHILAAYRLKKYEEAAQELKTFFDIEEDKIKAMSFEKGVDKLTPDETKALSMLIDPILESAEKLRSNPCSACSGTGLAFETYTNKCEDCQGKGHTQDDCPHCYDGEATCRCNGTGCGGGSICDKGRHYNQFIYGQWNGCRKCSSGIRQCNNCNGVGYLNKRDCVKCSGAGKLITTASEKTTCRQCNGRRFR